MQNQQPCKQLQRPTALGLCTLCKSIYIFCGDKDHPAVSLLLGRNMPPLKTGPTTLSRSN
jgi:hypothetical protein